jgi:hypothetical protein
MTLAQLTSADFAQHLNDSFMIHIDGLNAVRTELIQVTELGKGQGKRRVFSLIFRGAKNVYLPQRIYNIEHETMGILEIFIVSIEPDNLGSRFEAIFG